MNQESTLVRDRFATPRGAAIVGILFPILLISSLVLIRISVPARPEGAGS